jgi:hypothetical protein
MDCLVNGLFSKGLFYRKEKKKKKKDGLCIDCGVTCIHVRRGVFCYE